MRMNNKGFTVIELLASFMLSMIIVVLLFEVILELKNIYINESVKTEIINKNALAVSAINERLERNVVNQINCSGTSCTVSFYSASNFTISISGNTVTVAEQKFTYPEGSSLSAINLTNTEVSTTTPGNNHIFRMSFDIKHGDLSKDLKFNYIYTY